MEEELLKKLKGTSIFLKIKEVEKLYQVINKKEQRFCSTFNIHCQKNCGTCCEHFEPDVTYLEAIYLAYGLIKEGKALEILNKDWGIDQGKSCPFYSTKDFCTVYPYRPLICRLFNACASNDKYGNPIFKPCKWNNPKIEITKEEFEKHSKDVITMEEFGEYLMDEETGDEKTILLIDAVKKAIEEIMLVLEMEGKE